MIVTKKIPMVDLKGQYAKIKKEVDKGIQDVIDSALFINGPAVKEFEAQLAEYIGVKHVIACANGTDALQIAMMAAGLKPGDEVITASFTYVATAEVIALLGLVPVLVDVNPDTFDLDVKAVERNITSKTRAIVPVHLFGQCADMDSLMSIAGKHKLFVIEDVAQAIGSKYRDAAGREHAAGTLGDIGCTSFFPSKNLGCFGDGGAMYTNNDDLAVKMRMIAHHGQRIQYHHDVVGVNSRLDTLQAAVLKVKLRHLDQYSAARNKVADFYDAALAGNPKVIIPVRSKRSTHVFNQYTLRLKGVDRTALREKLAECGISTMIYYPLPLHMQKAFESPRYKKGDFPVTEELCATVLSLPIHTEMDESTLRYIADNVNELLK